MSPTAEEINEQIRYSSFIVFRRTERTAYLLEDEVTRASVSEEFISAMGDIDALKVEIRAFYDVSALRADADLMVWFVADTVDQVQDANRVLRRTQIGTTLTPVWASTGLHRPAEFNKQHVPAAFQGVPPKKWIAVYPFVRSYEWYLLPDEERRTILAEHGKMGREYPQVLASTTASFALGDYEWLLAFEADELHDIVDLMRYLRESEARRHVRVEIPFYTGRVITAADVADSLC